MDTERVSIPSLEYPITSVCQNRCIACNHLTPLLSPWFVSVDEFTRDVQDAARLLRPGQFALLGGEPLLHPDLLTILDVARQSEIAPRLSITTNGQALGRYLDCEPLWRLVDRLVIDRYPDKLTDADVRAIDERAHVSGVQVAWQGQPRWYACLTRGERSDDGARLAWAQCPHKTQCRQIDRGYLYVCPQSAVIPEIVMGRPRGTDGLLLRDASRQDAAAFLGRDAPLASCRRCSVNERFLAWREEHGRQAWLDGSMA